MVEGLNRVGDVEASERVDLVTVEAEGVASEVALLILAPVGVALEIIMGRVEVALDEPTPAGAVLLQHRLDRAIPSDHRCKLWNPMMA